MSKYDTIPDLISSSVKLEVDKNQGQKFSGRNREDAEYNREGTIYPFTSSYKSWLKILMIELSTIMRIQEARKIRVFLGLNVFSTILLLWWCRSTNSMALTAYTYLTIFDIMSLLTCLISFWVKLQKPTPAFSFGYERFEVLAVFASTMLAQLGSLFIIKESIERLLEQPEIHTDRLLVGTLYAFMFHMFITYSVNNRAINHVIDASSSSWLQEHMTDMSESVCHVIPGLSKLLLPRINPFALIAFTGGISMLVTYILIDAKNYLYADTWAAIAIAIMTCGTMFPISIYTGKILLQTSPSHILGQLDKVLREASTLDGVLEFRHEHFWTLSFGTLVGSVQVRVRRDADEQMVLAHVYSRLSNLVPILTIQIFKDDWNRASTYNILGSPAFSQNYPSSISPPRGPSPTEDYYSNLNSGSKPVALLSVPSTGDINTPISGQSATTASRTVSGNVSMTTSNTRGFISSDGLSW
ncbi:hypothetical protein ScPMuIL_014122 [Solemya velum]